MNRKVQVQIRGLGIPKITGIDELSSPTPLPASIRMVLGITAVKDWELRQLDVDMAYLETSVKEELYIELPEDYRGSWNQVGRLENEMYDVVHAGLFWSKTFSAEFAKRRFEQFQADPCVFRRVLRGNVVITVVYVDGLLVASKTKRYKEQATKDLRSCFRIKDSGRQDSISDATSRGIATR